MQRILHIHKIYFKLHTKVVQCVSILGNARSRDIENILTFMNKSSLFG